MKVEACVLDRNSCENIISDLDIRECESKEDPGEGKGARETATK